MHTGEACVIRLITIHPHASPAWANDDVAAMGKWAFPGAEGREQRAMLHDGGKLKCCSGHVRAYMLDRRNSGWAPTRRTDGTWFLPGDT
jgi:hypothetical protein